MIKSQMLPKSPRKEDDLRQWSEAEARALKSLVAELMNQLNWPVVSSAPTETPTRIPCIKLYQNGATYRLYIYYGGSWKYVTLT